MSISGQSAAIDDDDDANIEAPNLDEIEEVSQAPRRPIKRKPFKSRKMMGKAVYKGRDRIRPSEYCTSIMTYVLIAPPSALCLSVVPFDLAGWFGGALIFIIYWVSFLNVMRCLHMCSTVEPGIIPKIRTKHFNYMKSYKVKYR